jgi:hypothetical protein
MKTIQAFWWTLPRTCFYCFGCGSGGDVIRFAELYHQVSFPQALSLLRQWHGLAPLLHINILVLRVAKSMELSVQYQTPFAVPTAYASHREFTPANNRQ